MGGGDHPDPLTFTYMVDMPEFWPGFSTLDQTAGWRSGDGGTGKFNLALLVESVYTPVHLPGGVPPKRGIRKLVRHILFFFRFFLKMFGF